MREMHSDRLVGKCEDDVYGGYMNDIESLGHKRLYVCVCWQVVKNITKLNEESKHSQADTTEKSQSTEVDIKVRTGTVLHKN